MLNQSPQQQKALELAVAKAALLEKNKRAAAEQLLRIQLMLAKTPIRGNQW